MSSDIQNSYRTLRWIVLATCLLVAGTVLSTVTDEFSFSGRPIIEFWLVAGFLNIVAYAFVRTQKPLRSKAQFAIIGLIVLLQVGGYGLVRLDGVYGNGRPKFVWRWHTPPLDHDFENEASAQSVFARSTLIWPRFRGLNGQGQLDGFELSDWSQSRPRLVWERAIGLGWSSFAMAHGLCVTQEQRGELETVVCYHRETGKQVWRHVNRTRFQEVTGGDGPRATPTIEGEYVFALGATGILDCLQLQTGELIWSRNILKNGDIENRIFGMAGSPLVEDGLVIVTPGGSGHAIVAFDVGTGEIKWSNGSENASYSSPMAANILGTRSVLSFNADGLSCHKLEDGTALFHIPWVSNPSERNNVCQPIVFEDNAKYTRLFLSSAYGQGAAVFNLSSAEGEIVVEKVWHNQNLKSKFSSAVHHNGYVYGLDNGILVCLDLNTGKRAWKRGRFGHGQLVRVGSKLLVQSERGYIAQVACRPDKFFQYSQIDALTTRTWNHPATDGEYLLVRNNEQAMCFDLRRSNERGAEDSDAKTQD